VLYTDYSYALIYRCFRHLATGECAPSDEQVVVASRDGNLPESVIPRLVTLSTHQCYVPADFEFVPREGEKPDINVLIVLMLIVMFVRHNSIS
jgi:hypothetical protein